MASGHAAWIMLVGAAMVLTGAIDALARRTRIPAIVVYLLLGAALRAADERWLLLGAAGREIFALFADIGVIALLFRVGLESKIAGLLAQLRPALLAWVGNVALSGLLGYMAARHAAGLGLAASLVVAVALTATSIGMATAAWRNAGALESAQGRLMLNVAELDDISGVVLMALLFALVPVLGNGQAEALPTLARAAAGVAAKLALFAALCLLIARYVEGPLTRLASRLEPEPQRMLAVAGVGFLIAALAGWLGFSFAVGALMAGLVFSRDPAAIHTDARFADLYAFFAPFFFIGIGLEVDVGLLGDGFAFGGVLLVAAIAGKVVGAMLPLMWLRGWRSAVVIGVSLVPRAEIALVVAHEASALGVLPERAFAALVLVSAATCLLTPLLLEGLLGRWPQAAAPEDDGRYA